MSNETITRILQVEDHRDIASMLTVALMEIGCQVKTVTTCKEGVEAIQEESFDLYLFDNLLPDGTGIKLCSEVRNQDGNTPIIFHSGADNQSSKEAALTAGATAYMIKPTNLDGLVKLIQELLSRRS